MLNRICPHCGAYALRKAGIKNGYQQYKCTSCNKCSSDSPNLRLSGKTPCKHCDSLHTRKMGFTVTGYQKYKCLACGKCWSDSPFPKGSLPKGGGPKCPHCGKDTLWKAGIKDGYQKYRCTSCNKSSSDNPYLQPHKPCKYCGNLHTRKMGFTKTGFQRYGCLACDKISSDSPNPRGGSQPKGDTAKAKSVQDLKHRKEKKMEERD